MSLVGTLKGFGVTEIFQLISQQMKTGTLVVTAPKAKISILFDNGFVKGIHSDNWDVDPRVKILLDGGFVKKKDLTAAKEGEKDNLSWVDILIAQNKLSKVLIDKVTDVVLKDLFFDILGWGEGSYRFEEGVRGPQDMIECNTQAENIMLDTLRSIDEWPLVEQKVPPLDYYPVVIMPVTEDIVKKFRLTDKDIRIYDLIDGNKTIDTLVKESLETRHDVLSSIVRLMDAFLVEVFPKETIEGADRTSKMQVVFTSLKRASAYILLLIGAVTLVAVLKPGLYVPLWPSPVITQHLTIQKEMATNLSYSRQARPLLRSGRGGYNH